MNFKISELGKNTLKAKQRILSKLNKKSIASIATVQASVNSLININDKIDQTTHEIDEIESNFALIKGELDTRKNNNTVLINQIQQVMLTK